MHMPNEVHSSYPAADLVSKSNPDQADLHVMRPLGSTKKPVRSHKKDAIRLKKVTR